MHRPRGTPLVFIHAAYAWNNLGELIDTYKRLKSYGVLPIAPYPARPDVVPTSSCNPGMFTVPVLVRQGRNFGCREVGCENHDQRRRKPEKTKTGQDRSRKSPQKRRTWNRLAKSWFGRDRTCDPARRIPIHSVTRPGAIQRGSMLDRFLSGLPALDWIHICSNHFLSGLRRR